MYSDDNDPRFAPLMSRQSVTKGAAFVGGSATALLGQAPVLAQGPQNPVALAAAEAERQATSKTAGLRFRALVRYANTLSTETLTLRPIHPLQVVVRTQAAQTCYSQTGDLNTATNVTRATAGGHGGVGIVEEVGVQVKRVRVGDQVIVTASANCGVCSNCLNGRGDVCSQRLPPIPAATMSDGVPVYMNGPSGLADYMVASEDYLVPVFTTVPPAELSLLACVATTGLALAMCRIPVEAGTDVAVFGLGPIGASAVQGARIQGARTIVGIDPIRYRRELALKLGATHVFDPNADKGDALLAKIREVTADAVPAERRYTGQRAAGPMYSFEAVGFTRFPLPPSVETPSDPTGIEALQQAYTVARVGGYVRTAGVFGQGSTITFPTTFWAGAGGKTHLPGNFAGAQILRDIPRFVRLVERGVFDAKSLVGEIYKPDKMREALQVSADRAKITSVVDFT